MQTWTDTTYVLPNKPDLLLCVTEHWDVVSLHIPGYALDGQGFSIQFTTAHVSIIDKLAVTLRARKDEESHSYRTTGPYPY